MRRILPIVAALAGSLPLAGCLGPRAPTGYERVYPSELPRGVTLNVQVFRRTTELELTNTTARVFGPSTIWLNMWYSRPIEGLEPGGSLRFPLHEFRDEFGEAFYGGGFFATREPERLVLAELETEDEAGSILLRMIVVGQTEVQR